MVTNLAAGKGAGETLPDMLARYFAPAGIAYEIHETTAREEPGAIVRRRLHEGFDLVVAAGGDGTVSAVFDALAGTDVPLGIVATGTGNYIAREFDIPTDVDAAVALIAGTSRTMKIDAMRIDGRLYVLNASVGITAAVVSDTTPRNKSRFGRIAYAGTAARKIFRFRPRSLLVTVDGQSYRSRAVEVTISNCGILAKTLYPKGPEIRADDGRLDIWVLSMRSLPDYVRYFFGVLTGRRANLKAYFLVARKRISIMSSSPLTAQADGDVIGVTPLELEVLPGALSVLVPETSQA